MYVEAILKSGFDDLEALAAMEEVDIQDLGVLPRHAASLRRAIAKLNGVTVDDDAENPVAIFLREAGMEQYAEALLSQGFDDMESLLLVEDDDLRECGLLRGHAAKLRKRLRDYELGAELQQEATQTGAGMAHTAWAPQRSERPRDHGRRAAVEQEHAAAGLASQPAPRAAPPAGGRGALCPVGVGMVERSWQRVQAVGPEVFGGRLYRHVFDLAPVAMDLFPPEVRAKYRDWTLDEDDSGDIFNSTALQNLFSKIVSAVGSTVAGLRDIGKLVPMLERLGARHIHYGVSEDHWPILGRALDMTLRDFLGDEYTIEVQGNWTMVYNLMSAVMCDGFRQAKRDRELRAAREQPEKVASPQSQLTSESSTAGCSTADVASD